MHSAQRHAILAIIAMIEHGLVQLKGLLLAADDAKTKRAERYDAPEPGGYLTAEEEQAHERELKESMEDAAKARELSMADLLGAEEDFPGGDA